jgi:tRNA isopentenyl-2-thiomethyl-A-37 hydroxylase MiaE
MGVRDKTKHEWALRHLAQMGNTEPKEESIQYYLGLLDSESDHYDFFFVKQYERWKDRDEDQALEEYEEKVAEASTKTLNERYIEDEDNTGPFLGGTNV